MKAKAIVTLTLEIEADSVWGPDCTVAQVMKQSKDDVLHIINSESSLAERIARGQVRLATRGQITRVIITEE